MQIKRMKAAILVENNKPLVVGDIELPKELSCGQVLVKVHYSGICGAQINEIKAAKGPAYPTCWGTRDREQSWKWVRE